MNESIYSPPIHILCLALFAYSTPPAREQHAAQEMRNYVQPKPKYSAEELQERAEAKKERIAVAKAARWAKWEEEAAQRRLQRKLDATRGLSEADKLQKIKELEYSISSAEEYAERLISDALEEAERCGKHVCAETERNRAERIRVRVENQVLKLEKRIELYR